jgi:hypothetical protein
MRVRREIFTLIFHHHKKCEWKVWNFSRACERINNWHVNGSSLIIMPVCPFQSFICCEIMALGSHCATNRTWKGDEEKGKMKEKNNGWRKCGWMDWVKAIKFSYLCPQQSTIQRKVFQEKLFCIESSKKTFFEWKRWKMEDIH